MLGIVRVKTNRLKEKARPRLRRSTARRHHVTALRQTERLREHDDQEQAYAGRSCSTRRVRRGWWW
jgi:hypothetical protein